MYICRWFVLCETVVHDSGSNNLTMVNALTELRAPNFPALHPRFGFATLLDRDGEPEGPLSLRFVRETEDGDEVLLTVGNEGTPKRAQFFVNFPAGIRLLSEGKVTFRIEAREGENDWYTVGSQDILAVAAQQPAPSADPVSDPSSAPNAVAESSPDYEPS